MGSSIFPKFIALLPYRWFSVSDNNEQGFDSKFKYTFAIQDKVEKEKAIIGGLTMENHEDLH